MKPLLAVLLLGLPLASLQAIVNPSAPNIPERSFSITAHGAVNDDRTDNTAAIQATIDEALAAGGGTVEIPAGHFLSGPLHLGNQLRLHLAKDATLLMLPIDRYPGGTKQTETFLGGKDLHDVAITGEGTIDGQGAPWWPFAKTQGAVRPRMIGIGGSTRILIEGVHLQNAPMFHIAISGANDVIVRGVVIRAPASTDPVNPSHNTDACDVSGHNILIENCDVSVGDDNYTCGGNTSDVLIRNCKYGYGHGVSIGSGTKGGVSNITVSHCTFENTDCGIRIKTDRDRGGVVENMTYEDLEMKNVGFPVLIYAAYMAKEKQYRDLQNLSPATASSYPAAPVSKTTPYYRHFHFRNITATAAPGRRAGLIWGLPEAEASDITFENVNIRADKPFGIYNARGVKFTHCSIVTPEGNNQVLTNGAEFSFQP